MFILAESGSSKTDWLLFSRDGVAAAFSTQGINPDVQEKNIYATLLKEEWLPQVRNYEPEKLFFYGAGLRNPRNREQLQAVFEALIPSLKCEIEHDLLGSARAICGHEKGIACILGTGSNSCYFDGETVQIEKGGNGYLFGDEGSGADLGKALLKAALDEELDKDFIAEMEQWAGKSLLDIRRDVHLAPKINVELSRWSEFLHARKQHPQLSQLLRSRFLAFLEKTVCRYPDFQSLTTGFVGSVAFHYADILTEACSEKQVKAGKIIQRPAEELVKYHLQHV